jgi:hypothetical protein
LKGSNNIVDIVLARDKKMSVEKLKVLETKKGDRPVGYYEVLSNYPRIN